MDGTNSNQQEPCKQHKHKKRRIECDKGVVDRISELPDEIIYIILSFLPLRQAASTSLLSHRWPDLWKYTSNLDFIDSNRRHNRTTTEIEHDSWDVSTCKNVKMVNSVLESHHALFLKEFRLQFYINSSAQSTVTKWLKFVWSRQVERLKLKFICCNSPKHMLVLGDLLGEIRPMQHLKILSLRSLKVSGEDISLFLRICPLLRELSIVYSSLTSDVHVSGATLVLESFRISGCFINGSVINISAPNISIVSVDARPGKLWFKNVPRLSEATFGIKSSRYNMLHFASAVSCITSQLQKLSFSLTLYPKLLWGGFPEMPNLKELVVKDSSLYEHGCLLPLTSVISACPCLQEFMFEFLDNVANATPKVERCPHQNLKMLKFQGSSATDIIKSVTYISDCCDAFQKIKTCTPLMSKADVQAHREHMLHLQLELSYQVQLKFFKFIDK